jgi:hypothetical protein
LLYGISILGIGTTEQDHERTRGRRYGCLTVEGGIAWVKFNRPEKRNCMSPKLNRQMGRVIADLEFREDVRVLVLTGEGDAWSAGMDLKEYFPREPRPRAWARSAEPARSLFVVGTPALVRKADHRHDQRLVLWRRLWSAVRLRHRGGERGRAVRPFGNQLGHPARRRSIQGRGGTDAVPQGASTTP